MLTFFNGSDTLVIVLHEIYGINEHINKVCKEYMEHGYDVVCPNLLNLNKAFDYENQEEAYQYFTKNIGFDLASEKVKSIVAQMRSKYKNVFIVGYSIGATIAWLCSDILCDGVIGYYGSRIRDYLNINSKCKTLLIFPSIERSFNVSDLTEKLKKKENLSVYMLKGNHGFCDSFSKNYCEESYKESKKLVGEFLKYCNKVTS